MKLYTPLINKAMQIAYTAHLDQVDKCGVPYIFHPAYLASQMDTEEEIIVALLHDVIKNCHPMYHQEIRDNFNIDISETVELLTHMNGMSYENYMLKLMVNPLARKVRLADLCHYNNPTREVLPEKKTPDFIEKAKDYEKWIEILSAFEITEITPEDRALMESHGFPFVSNKEFINKTKIKRLDLLRYLNENRINIEGILIIFPSQDNNLEIYFRNGQKVILKKEEELDGKNED